MLGPLQVRRQDEELDLGPRQQRLILALLLTGAGQPVGLGHIIELLWGQHPPSSAVNIVHRYIGALRRLLEPGLPARSPGRWLQGDANGYRMRVTADQLDLLTMRTLAALARSQAEAGHHAEALSHFQMALALWRGPCAGAADLGALDQPAFSVVDHECAELAREATDQGLRLNDIRSLLPALRRMAESRPWDEALQAQLLLALSADGHQAEAITLYQDVRSRLATELGVNPGDELRTAYQVVLRPDPVRSGQSDPRTASPAASSPIAGPAAPAMMLPAQIPAGPTHFAGRDDTRRRIFELIDDHDANRTSTPVLSIDGIPGIGKTTLAIHLAHQLATNYPDGQLYVDLHGFDPEPAVMPPAEALQGFLNALGIPDSDIPVSDFARAGLYRSILAGRRILIVLDNARNADQVRPLLPGTPGCLVLITSRLRLTGLATTHSAHLLTLGVLTLKEARDFLATRLGARTSADPEATDEIIERCGRLPLALAVVAGRALAHPDHRMSDIAEELRAEHGSLDGFMGDDLDNNLRAIFSWSYLLLSPDAAHLFRLLALQLGPDLTIPAIASLIGAPTPDARRLIGQLVRTGLLTEHAPGRYRTHDLIRAYAQELVHRHEDGPGRRQAVRRLMDHYQRTAYEANQLLMPLPGPGPLDVTDGVVTAELHTPREVMTWFTANWPALRAVVRRRLRDGDTTEAWQLVFSLLQFWQNEGVWHEGVALIRECLPAVVAAGDDLGRAHMSRALAGGLFLLGDYEAPPHLLHEALELYDTLGRTAEQTVAYRNLAYVSHALKNSEEAVKQAECALRLATSTANWREQTFSLFFIGDVYVQLGRLDDALSHLDQALLIAQEHADSYLLGLHDWSMADYHEATGDLAASLARRGRALESLRELGWLVSVVETHIAWGDTALTLGDQAGARAAWHEALELIGRRRLPQAAEVQARLTRLDQAADLNVSSS
ncbi:NB-ARC domain-containing protein [Actinoplanes sp. TRM 88003]|uniref:NB-ARC domain-containing protein n=1 Tax=Paractinoplanes aksuensis TaxID=2939490 RepID=A0ABT1DZX0_9ACTN|nr:BTAD domain-containing putative transcriptional regulator [Actinoplanes aksuensis]MCO8275455.1 NB-ARC domain-containing protein [Actinoplanes aksuensis]